jgi:hypothetical protein
MRPHDLVAVAISIGVACSLTALAIAAAIAEASEGQKVSESAATLLSTVLGAAIGAVGTYLGGVSRRQDPPPRSPGDGADENTLEWPRRSRGE